MELAKSFEEDAETGALKLVRNEGPKQKAPKTEDSAIRRGVIRFTVVVLDCSDTMNQRDMRPTRLGVAYEVVSTFIENYFDQNPISQLALVQLYKGGAEKITELSGNARAHKGKLKEKYEDQMRQSGDGSPSIKSGLELASQMLEMQASYGTREVLLVFGSLSTVDRGDIFETMNKLQSSNIKVNIVGMAAEVYVLKAISTQTGGTYNVATHAIQLRDKVLSHTIPSAVLDESGDGTKAQKPAAGMWVGFPKRRQGPLPGWQCPRCQSLVPDVPADCGICGLKLLSSSHLARSYHHLFPVPSFDTVEKEEMMSKEQSCHGCGCRLGKGEDDRHKCPRCSAMFCQTCDGFIHEMLHVCPGCETGSNPSNAMQE